MGTIPICLFPTKVLLIDDNLLFSKELVPSLDDFKFTYEIYNNPQEALTFLTQDYKSDSFPERLISQPDELEWQHAMIDVNIYDLMKEIYNPKRFEQISTVIVDFDMPGMNGLEICEKITDPSIQKILLTGVADEHLAIQAFNRGLIHRYIKKEDPNIFAVLNQSLFEAQRAYFTKISQLMCDVATFNSEMSCLLDPVFVRFFENLLREKNIVEYYLFEITGNFLLLDEKANAYGLFIYNKNQLNMWHEDLSESDTAPEHLLKDLKSYKKMICFHNKNSISIPPGAAWEKYSYPLQTLEGGRETYYYACTNNMVDIELNKVFPFETFKKSRGCPTSRLIA